MHARACVSECVCLWIMRTLEMFFSLAIDSCTREDEKVIGCEYECVSESHKWYAISWTQFLIHSACRLFLVADCDCVCIALYLRALLFSHFSFFFCFLFLLFCVYTCAHTHMRTAWLLFVCVLFRILFWLFYSLRSLLCRLVLTLRSIDFECVICNDDRMNKCVYVLSTLTYFWFNRWADCWFSFSLSLSFRCKRNESMCVRDCEWFLFFFSFWFFLRNARAPALTVPVPVTYRSTMLNSFEIIYSIAM